MQFLTITFLSFIFTIFLTQYLIRFLTKKGILDRPNGEKRRMHEFPVPRMGGIVIVTVVLFVTFIFYQDIWSKKFFLTGAFIVFLIGLWDDIKDKKWYVKILFQTAAAHFLILSLNADGFSIITFAGYAIPSGISYIILLFLIVGIINAFNMLDGLDGLVIGLTVIISGMCFLLSLDKHLVFIPIISAALIGSSMGFLKFNANPARIFLGDSGSLFLGYTLAGFLLVISSGEVYQLSAVPLGKVFSVDILFLLIVLAVPITDTLRVMTLRMKNRRSPFQPDTNHLHHILYSKRIRPKTVVLLINTLSALFALTGVYYLNFSKIPSLIIFGFLLGILLNASRIIDFIIRKENLLAIGRMYRLVPANIPVLYRSFLLPVLGVSTVLLMLLLLLYEIERHQSYYFYLLIFQIPALAYAVVVFRRNNYYVDLIVFLNLIIFFVITGLNGFFYKMYPVPFIMQININQVFILLFSVVVILFILFKERIANLRTQFLTGVDLSIALSIVFVFILSLLLDIPAAYRISDTLLRSFLLFLFYKIIIITFPRFHFSLHFTSFAVSMASLLRTAM